ncbi:SPOR domain-containing protein [Cohnella cellulosilytica]|uniref:SPOR domain-containing protein n=1 Tax=Cohnella cellulosilytica TaxID=986710 RepID=A0ABW2F9Q6_9BACL
MPSNARMTIRFEPPVKPKSKAVETPAARRNEPIDITPPKQEEPPAAPATFEAWDSPYQDDIRALEEIIRKQDSQERPLLSETSFASRRKPKSDRGGLEDITMQEWLKDGGGEAADRNRESFVDSGKFGADNGWYDSITTTEIVRERGPSWGRVVLSVAGAIATGVLFGYMVLGLFTGEPLFPGQTAAESPARAVQASAGSDGAEPAGADGAKAGETPAAAKTSSGEGALPTTAEVAANRFYLLQYGVFRSEESMEVAVSQLKDKGYSWGTETNEGYRVYAAATMTKEEAELLASQMAGLEVYIKPVDGPALQVGQGRLTSEAAELVEASAGMIRQLVEVSGAGLQERQPAALGDKRLADWQAAQERWRKASAGEATFGGDAANEAGAIAQALKAGETAMAEYVREPSRKQLWNMQTAAMTALLADHRLRALLQQGE